MALFRYSIVYVALLCVSMRVDVLIRYR